MRSSVVQGAATRRGKRGSLPLIRYESPEMILRYSSSLNAREV